MEQYTNNIIKNEVTFEKNKYINESFMENYDNKDVDFNHLTFNRKKYLGKNYYLLTKILKKRNEDTNINMIHALLRKAYFYDNTNLDNINELIKIEKNLKSNKNKDETLKIIEFNEPIIQKDSNYFLKKIFKLISLFCNYNPDNVINKYDIENYLLNEFEPLKNVVLNFNNEISIDNTTLYFCSLYYNWLFSLCNKMEKSLNETPKEIEEIYYDKIFEDRNNLKIDIKNICKEIMRILEIKDVSIESEKFNIEIFESIVDKKINIEMVKEYNKPENKNKFIDLLNLRNIPKIKKIEKMISELRNKNKILKRYNVYFNCFYTDYLYKLQLFFLKIPKTIKYIKNLNYSEKKNVIVLSDFIFFLSYFTFDSQQIDIYINYYEKTFEKPDYVDNKDIIIDKNNNKIIIKQRFIIIENYEDYNLTLSQLNYIEKNRYLREHYIKFNQFQQKNLFTKYRTFYLEFFQKLFDIKKNSIIKKLFLKTFPILKHNYFINNNLLKYIFENKIYIFNLNNLDFVGLTQHLNMNIYLKGNYIGNFDNFENEICYFASFIIILIHELGHFIRIYIFKHLKLSEYEHSFIYEENEKAEIGRFIEKKLFGKVLGKINVSEAIYILNINNYLKDNDEEFLEGFINLKYKKINRIEDIDDNIQEISNKLNLDFTKLNFSKINDYEFTIKVNSNCFNIGFNNDKCETLEEHNRLFDSLNKLYKDIFKKD